MGTEIAGNEDRPCAKVQLKNHLYKSYQEKKKSLTVQNLQKKVTNTAGCSQRILPQFTTRALEIRSRDKLAAVRNGIRPWVNPS